MRVRPFHFALVLVSVAMACAPADDSASSSSSEPCALAPADVEAIHGMEAIHEADVLAANWEAMAEFYSPDVVAMLPNQAEVVGREPLLAWMETFPPITEYELTFEEVDGCGDLAYVKVLYSMAMQPGESAELVRDSGRAVWILRRSQEGRWILTRDIFNSALPITATPE